MLTDNTIRAGNADVYTNRIFELVDVYAAQLPSERDLTEPETFTGLIAFLYAEIFQNRESKTKNSVLDYDNVECLDNVWRTYVSLCGRYKQTPSLFEYCSLTGICIDTLTDWSAGRLRANDDERIRTIKRWKNACVAALEKKAINSNSIGAIFALKSAHGWKEASAVEPVITSSAALESPEQIAQRHRNASLPEKPVLDEIEDFD